MRRGLGKVSFPFLFVLMMQLSCVAVAEQDDAFDWIAVTLDNDLFVGNDNGYTNGFYVTALDLSDNKGYVPANDFWVWPLLWTLGDSEVEGAVNVYSIGQTLLSPSDITIEVPAENELPYAGLLTFSNTYLTANVNTADRISTTIGIIGPWALGEETQKTVHKAIGADEPQGWDTQLENELVFQFHRSRAWRQLHFNDGRTDIITAASIEAGTISSSVEGMIALRFGQELERSFPTTLLSSSRLSNPVAANQGWFFYLGLNTGYLFNRIFTNGNTFRNSRSIPYDKEYLGASAGLTLAYQNWAFTMAFSDSNIIANSRDDEALENLTRFGTFTIAWRI
ncbi:MAG: lipid A deacylase LpxR family protein [Oleiphilaceae bacterium]|nr:lipid A deacylase LpxR family protein [Oleiphilaceae bacterium]